jgi:hypothetical protein
MILRSPQLASLSGKDVSAARGQKLSMFNHSSNLGVCIGKHRQAAVEHRDGRRTDSLQAPFRAMAATLFREQRFHDRTGKWLNNKLRW